MTAAEVIRELKTMPAQEREKVATFLLEYEKTNHSRHADDQTVNKISDRILKKHAKLMRKLAS